MSAWGLLAAALVAVAVGCHQAKSGPQLDPLRKYTNTTFPDASEEPRTRHLAPPPHATEGDIIAQELLPAPNNPREAPSPSSDLKTAEASLPPKSPSIPEPIPPGNSTIAATLPWPLTLPDAIAIAMRNSAVVRVLNGNRLSLADGTSYDPAVEEERAREALAAFDTSFDVALSWNRYNGPPDTFFGPGIPQSTRRDDGTLRGGLAKRWFDGTETRLVYNPSPSYLYFPNGNPNGFNPSISSNLELGVLRPLWRGSGEEVVTAPIQIAQLRTEGSGWDFKRSMLDFTRSIEQAYWELQAAQVAEKNIAHQVSLVAEVVRITQAMFRAERATVADVAKARSEFHELRLRRLQASAVVQEKELQLRTLMNVPGYDGRIIDPITPPIYAGLAFDREQSVRLAMDGQPQLLRLRVAVRIREVENVVAVNGLQPQLDLLGLYRANGLDNDLGSSLTMMGGQQYQDWEFGARYSQPLGNRAAEARKRAADLQLQRERTVLYEQTLLVAYQVLDTIREIEAVHGQYQESLAQREQIELWLKGAQTRYFSPPPAGSGVNWLQTALDDYLKAMRAATEVAAENASLVARYNTSLAQLQVLEGTLLASRNVRLLADPCASVRSLKLAPIPAQRVLSQLGALPERSVVAERRLPGTDISDPEADAFVASRLLPLPLPEEVETVELARLPPVD